jgi:hypothetical protein
MKRVNMLDVVDEFAQMAKRRRQQQQQQRIQGGLEANSNGKKNTESTGVSCDNFPMSQ